VSLFPSWAFPSWVFRNLRQAQILLEVLQEKDVDFMRKYAFMTIIKDPKKVPVESDTTFPHPTVMSMIHPNDPWIQLFMSASCSHFSKTLLADTNTEDSKKILVESPTSVSVVVPSKDFSQFIFSK
jgi:hypothetical protein